MQLHGIELSAFGCKLLLEMPSQRQIHVVAAKQNVLANRDAVQLKLAGLFSDRNEGEIGGAAADVGYQDEVPHVNAIAPIRMPFDPSVKGGLRLFEQKHVPIAG